MFTQCCLASSVCLVLDKQAGNLMDTTCLMSAVQTPESEDEAVRLHLKAKLLLLNCYFGWSVDVDRGLSLTVPHWAPVCYHVMPSADYVCHSHTPLGYKTSTYSPAFLTAPSVINSNVLAITAT